MEICQAFVCIFVCDLERQTKRTEWKTGKSLLKDRVVGNIDGNIGGK